MTVTLRDIEVAIIQKIRDWATANGVKIDEPGSKFDAAKATPTWIRPRLTILSNTAISKSWSQWEQVVFVVECFLKSETKGCRFPALSGLVDGILALLDPARGAPCIPITNIAEPPPVGGPAPDTTGIFQINNVQVSMLYETGTVAHGVEIQGLDIATITLQGNVQTYRA